MGDAAYFYLFDSVTFVFLVAFFAHAQQRKEIMFTVQMKKLRGMKKTRSMNKTRGMKKLRGMKKTRGITYLFLSKSFMLVALPLVSADRPRCSTIWRAERITAHRFWLVPELPAAVAT
jgi:hypothetical protein